MIIPLRAEAVAFYRGWGTIAIGLVTIVVFFTTDPVWNSHVWLLQFGVFRPWQWVTSAFSHANLLHLIANMLFLFWFGQIVEGRLGWRKFVPLYLGLAAVTGCLIQFVMLAGGSKLIGGLGASGVIFGLEAIALLWAPRARFTCIFLPWPFRLFEMPLWGLCAFGIAVQLLAAHTSGYEMGSWAMHLFGVVAGVVSAVLLPHTGWVYLGDWEGLLDPLKGVRLAKPPEVSKDPAVRREAKRAAVLERIESLLAAKDGAAAVALHAKAVAVLGRFDLPPLLERRLIRCLAGDGLYEQALARIEAFLDRKMPDSEPLRLTQADILVRHLHRPREALAALAEVNHDAMNPDLEKEFARLDRLARSSPSGGE